MIYGIPEPGSYFRVPDDDILDTFVCLDCGEETEITEMAEPDLHDGRELCGWCAEANS